jgi:hypothetical protein
MNDSTRVIRRPRRARPSAAQIAAITAAASLALPATALGGGQVTIQKALAYSSCMRRHGVQKFPDPDIAGVIPKVSLQRLGVSGSQFQAALTACRQLLPSADQAGPPTQAELRQAWNNSLLFARCMRSHGVPNWPDPTGDSTHPDRPNFNLPVGIHLNSPRITTRIHKCEPLLDGWSPYVNSAANLPGT